MQRIIFYAAIFMTAVSIALGQIPQTMSYQGVLTDANGNAIQDGGHNFIFCIYEQESGGNPVWEEAQLVQTSGGLFEVALGQVSPLNLPFDRPYFLGISVDGGDEMSPRVRLTAAPYSLNAQSVVDGAVTANKIASGQVVKSVNNLKDNITLSAGENITISANDNTITISATGGGGSDGYSLDAADGDPSDAVFVDKNGNVGIGTTNPQSLLHVRGNITTNWDLTMRQYDSSFGEHASRIFLRRYWSGGLGDYMYFGVTGNRSNTVQTAMLMADKKGISFRKGKDEGDGLAETHMVISKSGNVGIGTTTPSAKLDVNGQIHLSGELNWSSTGAANLIPIAYGNIYSDGAISSGTGNFSCFWDNVNKWYKIRINGEYYSRHHYITIVTPIGGSAVIATTWDNGPYLVIRLYNSNGNVGKANFQFIVYKP